MKRKSRAKMGRPPCSDKALRLADLYTTPGTKCFGSITESALEAGYGHGDRLSAGRQGWKVLNKRKHIQEYIVNRLSEGGVTPETIRQRVARRFFSEKASNGDVARLGNLLADMVPGGKAPTKVDLNATMTIEQLVLAAAKKKK